MNRMIIVAGGPLSAEHLQWEIEHYSERVIAVDSGAEVLIGLDFQPEVLIGDFDSLPPDLLKQFTENGVKILRYPVDKDQTDLELAIDWAVDQGLEEVRVLGGLGCRLDHTLANIGLLVKALERGLVVWLTDQHHEIRVFKKQIEIKCKTGWAVSLIPLMAAKGVTTHGLQYPLQGEELLFSESRGLHNRFAAEQAEITVEDGIVLLVSFREELDHSFLSFKKEALPFD